MKSLLVYLTPKAWDEAEAANNTATGAPADTSCKVMGGWDGLKIDWKCLFATVLSWLLSVFNFMTIVAGWCFRVAFDFTVVKLSSTFQMVEKPVNTAWKVIRDLINMSFIFGLLYCAVMTILGDWVPNPVNTKKVVVSIIVGALLINFSLFFTKVIIDVSNNFAVAIYNNITLDGSISLADALFKNLGLEDLSKPDFIQSPEGTWGNILLTSVMGIFICAVAASIFFTIALLFFTRFITFLILMIKSPLAFAGSAFPQLSKAAGDFWGDLTKQAIWAPVFLLMLWVVMKFTSEGSLLSKGSIDGVVAGAGVGAGGVFMGTLLKFGMVIALLVFALKEAQSLASAGAAGMDKIANKVGGWVGNKFGAIAGGATIGVAGWTGRQIIGRSAQATADSKAGRWLKTRDNFVARGISSGLKNVGKASFDARAAGIDSIGGMKLGTANKGGFAKMMEDDAKFKADRAKYDLKEGDANDTHLYGLRTLDADRAIERHTTELNSMEQDKAKIETDKKDGEKLLDDAKTELAKHEEIEKNIASTQREAEAAKLEYDETVKTGNQTAIAHAKAKLGVADQRALEAQDDTKNGRAKLKDKSTLQNEVFMYETGLEMFGQHLDKVNKAIKKANNDLDGKLSKTVGWNAVANEKDPEKREQLRKAHIAGVQGAATKLYNTKAYKKLAGKTDAEIEQELNNLENRRQRYADLISKQDDKDDKAFKKRFKELMAEKDGGAKPNGGSSDGSSSGNNDGENK